MQRFLGAASGVPGIGADEAFLEFLEAPEEVGPSAGPFSARGCAPLHAVDVTII
jgi:hypothetical protein